MTNSKNFYELLGVQIDAEDIVIAGAYKALVKKYHPDIWKGTKAEGDKKLKEINEAFETLKDKKKRGEYDNLNGLSVKSEERESVFQTKGEARTEKKTTQKSDKKAKPETTGKNFSRDMILENIFVFFPRNISIICADLVLKIKGLILIIFYLLLIANFYIFISSVVFADKPLLEAFPSFSIIFTMAPLFCHSIFNDLRRTKNTVWNRFIAKIGSNKNFREIFFHGLLFHFFVELGISLIKAMWWSTEKFYEFLAFLCVTPAIFIVLLGMSTLASCFSSKDRNKFKVFRLAAIVFLAINLELASLLDKTLVMTLVYSALIVYLLVVSYRRSNGKSKGFFYFVTSLSLIPLTAFTIFMFIDISVNEAGYYLELENWVNAKLAN